MSKWTPAAILYRSLRKKAGSLQYTDKHFYLQRIKTEFIKNKEVPNEQELQKLFKVSIIMTQLMTVMDIACVIR